MFSKLLTTFLILNIVGCSYFFNNNEKAQTTYTLSISEKAGVSCLKGNTQLLKDYFDLQRSNSQIMTELVNMKSCIRKSVDLFLKHTKGSMGNTYTIAEVHDFLSQAFDSYSYPMGFMDEVVRLKHSLIGGAQYTITKPEITVMLSYVDFIYDAMASLSSERHLLFSQRQGDSRVDFLKASERLRKVTNDFLLLRRKSVGDFDYASLQKLIGYITGDALNRSSHWPKTLDLVNSLQALLTAGSRDKLASNQLPVVVDGLVQMYLGFLEYHKFVKDDDFFEDFASVFVFPGLIRSTIKNYAVYERPHVVESLNHIHKSILLPLQKAVLSAPNGQIGVKYFNDLVETLLRIGSLPKTLKADTLKNMVPGFFGRWLHSGNCGETCEAKFLVPENVQVLLGIVDDWKERQLWVNSIGQKQRERISRSFTVPNTPNLKSLKEAIESISHIHWEDYLVIGSQELTYKDLVIFNSIYTLTTVFTRPFNENWKKAKATDYFLTQDQTQSLYLWLRELGIDLKLVDPRSKTSGKNAFLEGNLFTSMAADPEKFSFPEIMEYLEITFTTGHKSITLMEEQFESCRLPVKDVFEYPKLEAQCFRNVLHAEYNPLFFKTLPHLSEATKTLDKKEIHAILNSLEKAARQGLIVNEPAETDTMRLMSSISQYSESLFLRFDVDRNNVFDANEYKKVLELTSPVIKSLLKSGLSTLEYMYIYKKLPNFENTLVNYVVTAKEPPGLLTAELELGKLVTLDYLVEWEQDEWPNWKHDLEANKVIITRSDVLLVISALSTYSRVNRIKAMKKIFESSLVEFGGTIKDVKEHEPVFEKLADQIQCSTVKYPELKQWLIDNQKLYWSKKEDFHKWAEVTVATPSFEDFTWNSPGTWIPKSKNKTFSVTTDFMESIWSTWSGSVTRKLIELLYKNPQLSPYCGLPYIESVQPRARRQAPRKVRAAAEAPTAHPNITPLNEAWPYGP